MGAAAKAIDGIVTQGLAKALKAEGYRKSGRTFRLVAESCVRVVNVQLSMHNFGDRGEFWLNLGVAFPTLSELMGHECAVQQQIGSLDPKTKKRGDSWKVDAGSDPVAISADLMLAWQTCGKPFMDQAWENDRKARDLMVKHHWYEAAIAATILHGERAKVKTLTKKASDWFTENGNKNAAAWIFRRADELLEAAALAIRKS